MKEFTIEDLDRSLSYPTIMVIPSKNKGPEHFERMRKFIVFGKEYTIEWWKNISYLFIDGVQIPFYGMQISNTWPNRSKMNLQFYDDRDEVCCVLKIEDY